MTDRAVNEQNFLLSIIFPVTSLAGLAQLLRNGKELTRRSVFSALLYSGLLGVGTAALMDHFYGAENWALILGLSVLSGLGGTSAVDMTGIMISKAIKALAEKDNG